MSTYDAKEAEGSPSITDETSVMTRASQREMPRTGKSKPLIHALQLVRELQAKKHAADDKMEIVHLREGSPEVLTATHGLNLGAQLVPADQQ